MSEEKQIYDATSDAALLDAAAAQRVIDAERERRAQECAAEYNALVEKLQQKWNCKILYLPQFEPDGRITARPMVAPR